MVGIGFFITLIFIYAQLILVTRYKRCGPDEILVVFGKIEGSKAAKFIHGGGTLVWPLIQDYKKLSLIPMTIHIPLPGALSQDKTRINVLSTFTVGISTDPAIMSNVAERLLPLTQEQIEEIASEIIFGQLRLTVSSLTIEQINQDKDNLLELIRDSIEVELNKIGLHLNLKPSDMS